jgi:hypothetical protein
LQKLGLNSYWCWHASLFRQHPAYVDKTIRLVRISPFFSLSLNVHLLEGCGLSFSLFVLLLIKVFTISCGCMRQEREVWERRKRVYSVWPNKATFGAMPTHREINPKKLCPISYTPTFPLGQSLNAIRLAAFGREASVF